MTKSISLKTNLKKLSFITHIFIIITSLNQLKEYSLAFGKLKFSCVAQIMDPPELTCSFIIEINISLLSLSRYVEGSSKIHTLAGQNDNLNRLNLLFHQQTTKTQDNLKIFQRKMF